MADQKIYTIPLRPAFRKSTAKRIPYAMRYVRDYVQRHAKAEKVMIGAHLNETMWSRSKPPRRVRVNVIKEAGVAKVELFGFTYKEFKAKPKTEKKDMKEKLMARMGAKAARKEAEEQMIEGKPGKKEASEKQEKKSKEPPEMPKEKTETKEETIKEKTQEKPEETHEREKLVKEPAKEEKEEAKEGTAPDIKQEKR